MNKFFEAFANIFRIPDLRRRVLFTLALLAVYRSAGTSPRRGSTPASGGVLQPEPGHVLRLHRSVLGRHVPPADDLRPGHHALHHGLHHSAVADRGGPDPRETAEGRRTRPAEDHPVDALPDRGPGAGAVVRHRHGLAGAAGRLRAESGLGLHRHDHADPDHGHGLHHVAGRADQRPRHRQRHVADHLRRHRGRACPSAIGNFYTNLFVTRPVERAARASSSWSSWWWWWPSSCWWSAASGASRCSTPSAWWAGA